MVGGVGKISDCFSLTSMFLSLSLSLSKINEHILRRGFKKKKKNIQIQSMAQIKGNGTKLHLEHKGTIIPVRTLYCATISKGCINILPSCSVSARKEWSFAGSIFPEPFALHLPSNGYQTGAGPEQFCLRPVCGV